MKKKKLILQLRNVALVFLFAPVCLKGQLPEANKSNLQGQDLTKGANNLKDVLRELANHYRVDILFDSQLTNSLTVSNYSMNKQWKIEKNLDRLLDPLGMTYKQVNKTSYLIIEKKEGNKKKRDLKDSRENRSGRPANSNSAQTDSNEGQGVELKGRVNDNNGDPLSGVSILIKDTRQGTISFEDGSFSLNIRAFPVTLVFSYVGYMSGMVTYTHQKYEVVTLRADTKSLEDLIVIGYGSIRKTDLTGSVVKIGENNVRATPVVSLDRAVQGRAAGVQVVTNSAKPGGEMTIRIRGAGSVNASNDPLYVIDGFPADNLSSINTGDIESIEILKDASATAIYGSRGSNGVVLVTTKRGTAEGAAVSYEMYYGMQSARRLIPLLNGRQFAELVNEAQVNNGGVAYFDGSTSDRPLPEEIGEGRDWQKSILQKAPIRNHQLRILGGAGKTKYALSFGYYDQDGIIRKSGFQRYTLRANVDSELSSRFKTGLTFQGAFSGTNEAQTEPRDNLAYTGVISSALNYSPTFKEYNDDGTYYKNQGQLNGLGADNPLAMVNEYTNKNSKIRLLANAFIDFRILDGFNFRTSFGADLQSTRYNYYVTRHAIVGASLGGSASVSSNQRVSWLQENTLNYSKQLDNGSYISAIAGYSIQRVSFEGASARANTFPDDFAEYNNLGAGSTLVLPGSSASEWALISYLARVNYSLRDRFLFTLTGRRDGSARFGPDRKFGFFPSGAVAWKLHNEKWMKQVSGISEAKVRMSYGLSGNQEIGNYQYYANITSVPYVIGGSLNTGSAIGGIANPDLRWERSAQFDVGLDVGLFENKVHISADYYHKKTFDLLFNVGIPTSSGFSSSLKNIGSVQNRGLELTLGSVNIRKGSLKWTSEFNVSFNRNKILTLDGREEFRTGADATIANTVQNPILLRVGSEIGNYYGLVTDGIFQNQAEIDVSAQKTAQPGDIRYRDKNGDGMINDSDRDILGNANPDFFGGLNNTFSFKGFDLNVFVQGSYGNEILNYGSFDQLNLTGGNNLSARVLDRWTPANPSNSIPRANAGGGSRLLSSLHVEDGSYLRFKNISLGYNFPAGLLSKIRMRGVKIYLAAQNFITFTRYWGYDPEVNRYGSSSVSQGIDYGGYPAAKTLLFGINLKF